MKHPDDAVESEVRTTGTTYLLIAGVLLVYWFSTGIGILEAVSVMALLSAQTASGVVVWRAISGRGVTSTCENIGMGFALGSIALVLARQASLALNYFGSSGFASVVLLCVILGPFVAQQYFFSSRRIRIQQVRERRPLLKMTSADVTTAAAVGAALLGAREFISPIRLTVTGLLLLTPLVISGSRVSSSLTRLRNRLGVTTIILLVVSPAWLESARPWRDWPERLLHTGSDDVIFSEALAYLVDLRGPFMEASQSEMLRYHWFSLAWSGFVGRTADIEPLLMSTVLAPSIGYAVIVCLAVSILESRRAPRLLPIVAVITTLLTSSLGVRLTTIFVETTSNIFSIVFLFASVKICVLPVGRRWLELLRRWIVLFVVVAVTALTKAPTAVVFAVAICGASVLTAIRRRRLPGLVSVLDFVIATAACGFVYLAFLSGTWSTNSFGFAPRSIVDFPSSLLIGLGLSIVLILIRIAPILMPRLPQDLPEATTTLALASVPSIAVDFLLIYNDDIYFINAALALVALGIAGKSHVLGRFVFRYGYFSLDGLQFMILMSGLTLCSTGLFDQLQPSRSRIVIPAATGIVLLTAASFMFLHGREMTMRRRLVALVMVVSLLFGVSARAIQSRELPSRPEFPSAVESRVLTSIRASTPNNAVIATNFGICDLSGCELDDYRRLFIPALSHRTPYVLVLPQKLGLDDPPWIRTRVANSLNFAEHPGPSTSTPLIGDGATHYLLSRTTSEVFDRESLERLGRIVVEDENFVLLEFAKASSR